MKILFLSKYDHLGASSRYRILQYIEFYKKTGIICKVLAMFPDGYIRAVERNNNLGRSFYLFVAIVRRLFQLLCIPFYKNIYIEKELIPYFPAVFEWFMISGKKKYILDYDDAIFEFYRNKKLLRNKIPYIVKKASAIITGSPYLTKYCLQYNMNVYEIPTSINLDKYIESKRKDNKFIIGWIGGKASSIHLCSIMDVLVEFANRHDDVEVHIIGFNKELVNLEIQKNKSIKIIPWSDDTEIEEMNQMTCGIMPLINTTISKGKCGFKLIQYMACRKPTIASPFEANLKIGKANNNLFATNHEEWLYCLEEIYHNRKKFEAIGALNRKTVESYYSIQANAKKYIKIFDSIYE